LYKTTLPEFQTLAGFIFFADASFHKTPQKNFGGSMGSEF